MTTTFLTRIDGDLLAAIDAQAEQASVSRNQWVVDTLAAAVGDYNPPLLLGWIAITRPGEVDAWHCPECGQEMLDPHVGIMSSSILTGVICGSCATTD